MYKKKLKDHHLRIIHSYSHILIRIIVVFFNKIPMLCTRTCLICNKWQYIKVHYEFERKRRAIMNLRENALTPSEIFRSKKKLKIKIRHSKKHTR